MLIWCRLDSYENFYQENKEKSEKIEQLYEKRLKDKEDMIEQLKKTIEKIGNHKLN